MPDEAVMRKVRSLLELAEDAGTEHEATNARERAEALMIKHAIDEAILAEAGPEAREEVTSREITLTSPYADEKSLLLTEIAEVNRVRTVSPTRPFHGKLPATLVGYPSDLDRVEVLFTSLLLQASREVMQVRPGEPSWIEAKLFGRESLTTYRRSWMLGFSETVGQRLRRIHGEQQAQAEARNTTGHGTELVLADRQAAVDDAFAHLFPNSGTRWVGSSGTGHGAGADAGRYADLGQTRIRSDRRALPR
jgi:hypothetical protein